MITSPAGFEPGGLFGTLVGAKLVLGVTFNDGIEVNLAIALSDAQPSSLDSPKQHCSRSFRLTAPLSPFVAVPSGIGV